jgi:hypothetical protein
VRRADFVPDTIWVRRRLGPAGASCSPLAGSFHSGALLRLTARGDGTAQGRFHGDAAFMYLRGRRRDGVL